MHERLLSTPRFSVERRVYTRPGHKPVSRDVVVHPGAVVILPFVDPGRIVMIRNFRHAVEQELWELPAGTREPNEAAIDTARRELEEETGYRAATLTPFIEFYTTPGFTNELMYAFVATDLRLVGQRLEPDENITVEVVDLVQARRMLVNGELRDGKSIAVLGTYFARA
jgi:ADP-ribose pyrophosphatase